ncbi:hypothetical protein NMY22_g11815 [Coprinellus aureogranulatus]|nr:hypothetical protein NMY22_g11815 [Coprinellus aureogranulatus]
MASSSSIPGTGAGSSQPLTLEEAPMAAPDFFTNSNNSSVGNVHAQTAGRDINQLHITVHHYTPSFRHSVGAQDTTAERVAVLGETSPVMRTQTPGTTLQLILKVISWLRGDGDQTGQGAQVVCSHLCCGLDTDSQRNQTPLGPPMDVPLSSAPTPPEIYVSGLLKAGLGLPCWSPAPSLTNQQSEGVVPGDVGLYTVDKHFKRIFNLWEDELAIRALAKSGSTAQYQPLRGRAVGPERALEERETILEGAYCIYSATASSTQEEALLHEFHCKSSIGAILAITSPSDLFETSDKDAMQSYIVQHAEAIYQHANSIQPIGQEDSLYIITGCIKSDSWAIAAYRGHHTEPPYNILQLSRTSEPWGNSPRRLNHWTRSGSSHARSGHSLEEGLKNQTLFLRGFKVAFSPRFRTRMKKQVYLDAMQSGFKDEGDKANSDTGQSDSHSGHSDGGTDQGGGKASGSASENHWHGRSFGSDTDVAMHAPDVNSSSQGMLHSYAAADISSHIIHPFCLDRN